MTSNSGSETSPSRSSKLALAKFDIGQVRRGGERPRVGDVTWVEVEPEDLAVRICRGNQVGRISLSAAEITIGEWLARTQWRGNPSRESHEREERWTLQPTKVMHIGGIGDVTRTPIGHSRNPHATFSTVRARPYTGKAIRVGEAGPITDEPAGDGKLAQIIHCRYGIASRQ